MKFEREGGNSLAIGVLSAFPVVGALATIKEREASTI